MRVRHVFKVNIIVEKDGNPDLAESIAIGSHIRDILNAGLEGKAFQGRELCVAEIYPTNSYETQPRDI